MHSDNFSDLYFFLSECFQDGHFSQTVQRNFMMREVVLSFVVGMVMPFHVLECFQSLISRSSFNWYFHNLFLFFAVSTFWAAPNTCWYKVYEFLHFQIVECRNDNTYRYLTGCYTFVLSIKTMHVPWNLRNDLNTTRYSYGAMYHVSKNNM